MIRRSFASLVLVAFLAACAADGGGYGSSPVNKQNIGGVAGAVLGGVAGSTIGGGKGQLWATGAGVLVGALVGSEIGKSLDRADQMYAQRAFTQAVAAPNNQQITWSNPESGNAGSYTPVRSGRSNDGRTCREFKQSIVIDGKTETGVGTACQSSDGTWQIN
jgi:surface antigen